MRKIKHKRVFIFIILVVALYIVIYVAPRASRALQPSYEVEYGSLQTYNQVEGYIVRNEVVYLAGNGGTENILIEEGKLARKGTTILKIDGNSDAEPSSKYDELREAVKDTAVTTDTYKIESEGIVSYHIDGCEGELTPENMKEKNAGYYSNLSSSKAPSLERRNVSKGDPVFKLVDRSNWYIVCYIPKESKERYTVGKRVTVNIGDGTNIKAKVYSIDNDGNNNVRLILSTNYTYENFDKERVINVKVITSETKGLIIENSSISEKDGAKGVYVKQKTGGYTFTKINVLSTDGKKSVVSQSYYYDAKGNYVSTLKNYDEVLKKGK